MCYQFGHDKDVSQPTFTCLKSTIKKLWTYFASFFNVSIVDYEQVNVR